MPPAGFQSHPTRTDGCYSLVCLVFTYQVFKRPSNGGEVQMRLKNAPEYAIFELADVTVHIRTNGRTVTQDVYRTAGLIRLRHITTGKLPEMIARALYTELFAEYLSAGSVVSFGPRVMRSLA